MGLLKHLVLWPVTDPSALLRFSLRHVEALAHRELTDDTRVKSELLELQMLLELGEIDEDEYTQRETAALDRLKEVRDWRRRLGMEEEWAPLSFSGSQAAGAEVDLEGDEAADAESPPRADEPGGSQQGEE